MDVTLQLDDSLLSLIRQKAQNISVQAYIEDLLLSTFNMRKKDLIMNKIQNYKVSPYIQSLSIKGEEKVPNEVDGMDVLIEEKYRL